MNSKPNQAAWDGRVGKVAVLHDQGRSPRGCDWFPRLAQTWANSDSVQLLDVISLLCSPTKRDSYLAANPCQLNDLDVGPWFVETLYA